MTTEKLHTNGSSLPAPLDPAMDKQGVAVALAGRMAYGLGNDSGNATRRDWYNALALTVRERLMSRWLATQRRYASAEAKKVYYLSLEYLIGRSLTNATMNLDMDDTLREVLMEVGVSLEDLREVEPDAGLGNGGLGRLAACYLDSMATCQLPGFGYGIRYDYGIFTQVFGENGEQIERPTNWLRYTNLWEMPREERRYTVRFGGRVTATPRPGGDRDYNWIDTDSVLAIAYDTPVPGNDGETVNHLRLWSAQSAAEFNLSLFNAGQHAAAAAELSAAEHLSHVLYPDDSTEQGKELRLRQQYFFVSASLQDIVQDHLEQYGSLGSLPDKVAIQLNDTHPAVAIPELMRICRDEHSMSWAKSWGITRRVFSYTNHTLLPEALETWSFNMFQRLLPRHLNIILKINRLFLDDVAERFDHDVDRIRRMSLIDEEHGRRVRMANLAIVGSHKVNGVAAMHSQIMTQSIFRDFYDMYPDRFTNVTNGVTQRRWLKEANPGLRDLINETIGNRWEGDLEALGELADHAENPEFRAKFAAVKHGNKAALAESVERVLGIRLNPDSLFDVQAKRIHEYKRQLLCLLYAVTRYLRILKDPEGDFVPRTILIAGKAAPGYVRAKQIVKLINNVARVINNDERVGDRLKLVMIPNYNVSVAQHLLPAADLSEQISTAGMEASGTGNMKLALNGALTIGTLDGANVEIRDAVGDDNIFIFGLTAEEVEAQRTSGYFPREIARHHTELREVLDLIAEGGFPGDSYNEFTTLVEHLMSDNEHFLVLADYASYVACQDRVDALYRQPDEWARKAIINTAKVGFFSSDRSIRTYASEIWDVKPVPPE
ncbi:MAG: glycogen/starch/alpha-glucan phosphorylase [Pseudomonadota bacterium]